MKELNEMNRQKEILAKSKSVFFASVSHELRNPLNALLGSVELLASSENASEFDSEILNTAKICGETLLNLIGNVLDVSKIENDKLELYKSSNDLNDLIQKAWRMNKITGNHKGLFVKLGISPGIPDNLEFDSQKLMQVVINILGNAIKFTKTGGVFIKVQWIPLDSFQNSDSQHLLEQSFKHKTQDAVKKTLLISDRRQVVEDLNGNL